MKAFFRAIKDVWEYAPSLTITITGGLHRNQAPVKQDKPYAVVYMLGGIESAEGFKGNHRIEQVRIQFSIFERSALDDNILGYIKALNDRFHRAVLPFKEPAGSVHKDMTCRKLSPGILTKDEKGIWMYVVDYVVLYQE